MKITQKIKQLREDRGVTMKETARRVGVSTSTYRNWECKRKIPISHASKIAKAQSISHADLLGKMKPKDRGQLLETIELIEEALKRLKAYQR